MYAIVKTGGKQYRVERGQKLLVERLPAAEGADVSLEPMLYRSEEAIFDADGLASVQVTAKVIAHVRGEKLRVFKFKPKRGYKRRTGHRQELTQIEVTDISAGKAPKAKTAAKPAADATPAAGEAKARAAASAAPEGKPAAKAPKAKAAASEAKAAKAKAAPKAEAEPEQAAAAAEKPAPRAKAAKPKQEDA